MKRAIPRFHAALLIALAALLAARAGRADPSDADRAAATQLFKDGRALLEKKDYARACPKLEESQRLDPGGGTLLNVAQCHESQGRLATAWTEFSQALGLAFKDKREDRAAIAQQHIDALEPQLSRLSIMVPPEVALVGLELKRDGTVLGRAVWGSALPVDAGAHVIEISAPGRKSVTLHVEVGTSADRASVTVPLLEPLPEPPAVVVAPPIILPPTQPTAATKESPPSVRGARIASYLAFGFGGAWIGVGAVTGGLALARRNESDSLCVPQCTEQAYVLNQEAKPLADAATASFVIAGLSTALGATLLAIDLSRESNLKVSARASGLELRLSTW